MIYSVKIRTVVDPRILERSIEADTSAAALKLALTDFERMYPAADVRDISVSVLRKSP